jgi:uncharacterized protein with GYD domain
MPTFVSLCNFTEQGARTIKDTVKRAEAAKQAAAQAGVTIKEVLWTQGQYDMIIITESADEIAANAVILTAGKAGNLRGQTLRAYTAAEMQKIVDKVL